MIVGPRAALTSGVLHLPFFFLFSSDLAGGRLVQAVFQPICLGDGTLGVLVQGSIILLMVRERPPEDHCQTT